MTPKYRNNKISSDVSRASQTHQAPQIGLPHKEPVVSAKAVKQAPSGAEQMFTTKAIFIRQIRPIAPATAITT